MRHEGSSRHGPAERAHPPQLPLCPRHGGPRAGSPRGAAERHALREPSCLLTNIWKGSEMGRADIDLFQRWRAASHAAMAATRLTVRKAILALEGSGEPPSK